MNKEEKVIPENNCCTGFVQSLDRMHKMRDMAEQLGLHEYVEAFKLGGGDDRKCSGCQLCCGLFYWFYQPLLLCFAVCTLMAVLFGP